MKPRVCFVSQRAYPGDVRLSTAIQAAQEAGFEADMVCTRSGGQPWSSVDQNVHIYRLPSIPRKRAGKIRYIAEYVSFLFPAFFFLAFTLPWKRYKIINVTNLPDALVFCALIPKLFGAKVIFDVRECTPEMFMDRFGGKSGGRALKVMIRLEQISLRFADIVITCTEQMRQALISRGADPKHIEVILNVSDSNLQTTPVLPDPTDRATDSFRIIMHGTIIKRYGHDVLIKAMALLRDRIPQAHLEIFGRGEMQPELEALTSSLKLNDKVTFGGFVSQAELTKHLHAAHVGVIPIVRNPESDLVHTYKMYEYITFGLPIAASRTTAVQAYFNDDCIAFFNSGDAQSLADCLIDLYEHPEKRLKLATNALSTYDQYTPVKQRAIFRAILNRLWHQPHDQTVQLAPR